MADYNSIHTGAQIDDAVGRALSGRAGINPNLLDNWYFSNPVNQRGQTEYTGAGYTIDRWKLGSDGLLLVEDGYISFDPLDGTGRNLEQPAEIVLEAGTYTISALLENAGGANIICGVEGGYKQVSCPNDEKQVISKTFSVSERTTFTFHIQATKRINIYAAGMELGSQQTLAHQENGVWVLNEIPNYAEELAKCQRYQQVFCGEGSGYAPLFNGYFHSDVSARFAIPLSVPMAKKPSIVYVNEALLTSFSIRGDGATRAMASLAISYTPNTNVMSLYAVVSGATANNACAFITNGLRGILLDANL